MLNLPVPHRAALARGAARRVRVWLYGLATLGLAGLSWFAASSLDPQGIATGGSRHAVVALADAAVSVMPAVDAAPHEVLRASGAPAGGDDANAEYDLAAAPLMTRTLSLIEHLYLESESLKPSVLFLAGVEGLARQAPDALWVPAKDEVPGALMVGRRVLLLEPDALHTLSDLAPAFARVFAFYLQAREIEVEDAQVEYAAIRGMLSHLDRPTRLLIDDRLDDFKIRSRGSLSGIGCRLSMRQEEATVIEVMEDSPSAAAGLQEGDRIVRVDGESTTNMGLSEVANRLRGPIGTWVLLNVLRGQDATPLSFRILRDRIKLENVEAARLPNDIGYVGITNFNDETLSNFRKRLNRIALNGEGLKGMVIDLRQNGGGSLRQSAYMVDEFISSGTIVKTQGRSEQEVQDLVREIAAQEPQILSGVPIAILVDRRTASGAEILAGALKYLDRAILIGQRTYGKGSVQKVYPLNQHASLKLTVARYLLPGEHYIQTIGIQPDIMLVPLVTEGDNLRFKYPNELEDDDDGDELLKAGKPAQVPREEPLETVYYLEPAQRGTSEQTAAERLWSDFQVRFAAELLEKVRASSRPELLTKGRDYIEHLKAEGAASLVAALQARGIDWTVGGPSRGARADARLSVSPADGLHGGDKATLTLNITNRGTAPFSRLRVTSASEDPLFDRLEFLFGRIAPGETRAWPVRITVPPGAAPGMRSVTFNFDSEGVRVAEPYEAGLTILDGASPALEIEASYEDTAPAGGPGDNNRIVEVGERVAVKLWVRNEGAGPTGQLSLSLKNPLRKGLELREGRRILEPIPPGEQREATLSFDVNSLAGPKDPEHLELELQVVDRAYHIRLARELDFGQPWSGRLQIAPPRLSLTSNVPSDTVSGDSYTLAGQVSGPQGIRQVTFYRGREKVQRILPGMQAERPVTVLPFRTEIALAPGANQIEVVSEDEGGLITRKRIWVRALHR